MNILSVKPGVFAYIKESKELKIRVPVTFILSDKEQRIIHDCNLNYVKKLDGSEVVHQKDAEIFQKQKSVRALKKGVVLRPEDREGSNTLFFQMTIVDVEDIRNLIKKPFAVSINISFSALVSINFVFQVQCHFQTKEVTITNFRRQKKSKMILANLSLLILPVIIFYFWNNYINKDVHSPIWLIKPKTINLFIGVFLGFFSLQLLEIFSWGKKLENLVSVCKYPELYLNKTVQYVFRSTVTLFITIFFALSVFTLIYINWPIKLPKNPDPSYYSYIDNKKNPIDLERIYAKNISEVSLVCKSAISLTNPIPLAHLNQNSPEVLPLKHFGEVDLIPFNFEVRREFPNISNNRAVPNISSEQFKGTDVHDLKLRFGKNLIKSFLCSNTRLKKGKEELDYNPIDRVFLIKKKLLRASRLNSELYEANEVIGRFKAVEIYNQKNHIEKYLLNQLANDDSWISKDIFLKTYLDIMDSFDPLDMPTAKMKLGKALMLYELYSHKFYDRLEPVSLRIMTDLYCKSFKKPKFHDINKTIIKIYWKILLNIEKDYEEYCLDCIHNAIKASIEKHEKIDPIFYIFYLKECALSGLLNEIAGGDEKILYIRKDFFSEKKGKMARYQQVFEKTLQDLLKKTNLENTKVFLQCLLPI